MVHENPSRKPMGTIRHRLHFSLFRQVDEAGRKAALAAPAEAYALDFWQGLLYRRMERQARPLKGSIGSIESIFYESIRERGWVVPALLSDTSGILSQDRDQVTAG